MLKTINEWLKVFMTSLHVECWNQKSRIAWDCKRNGNGTWTRNGNNGFIYVSPQLRVQNAVSAQPCVGKLQISLVLLNFLHCNFRLWFETT